MQNRKKFQVHRKTSWTTKSYILTRGLTWDTRGLHIGSWIPPASTPGIIDVPWHHRYPLVPPISHCVTGMPWHHPHLLMFHFGGRGGISKNLFLEERTLSVQSLLRSVFIVDYFLSLLEYRSALLWRHLDDEEDEEKGFEWYQPSFCCRNEINQIR